MRKGKNTDLKPHRITIRLSDKHFEFVDEITNALGVSSTDYFRMILDKQISLVNRKELLKNEHTQSNNND